MQQQKGKFNFTHSDCRLITSVISATYVTSEFQGLIVVSSFGSMHLGLFNLSVPNLFLLVATGLSDSSGSLSKATL